LEGNYCGTAADYKTLLQGMYVIADRTDIRVLYAEGSHLFKDRTENLAQPDNRIAEAMAVTRRSDLIVLCVGLDGTIEGEEGDAGDGDKPNLLLPECQRRLMEKVYEAAEGKPIIVVVISGSALDLRWADQHANAVMQAFYPGAFGGLAIASALFGYFSPQGKLPVTFYRSDDDLPDFRDYSMENRTYRYYNGKPLYPFGFGLSYTRFDYGGLNIDYKNETAYISLTVTNAGGMDGGEIVQLYTHSTAFGLTRPVKLLRGFARVQLSAGQSRNVRFTLPAAALAYCGIDMGIVLERGTVSVYIGASSDDIRLTGTFEIENDLRYDELYAGTVTAETD
jgi:beta-glucosidase